MTVKRLSREEFKAAFRGKGWKGKNLAARWEISETWLSLLGNDLERAPYWDDAVRGLPKFKEGDAAVVLMLPEEFGSVQKGKGWSGVALAKRWEISTPWVSEIKNKAKRAPHWDDALRGLPKNAGKK